MLLEKKPPHFLTSVFIRIFATAFLLVGGSLVVISMVQFSLGHGLIERLVFAVILLFSGALLMRLRSRGLWVLLLLILGLYIRMIWQDSANFWPQFFLNFTLLLILCLIFPSYFALRRGEGRRTTSWSRLFMCLPYIALTSLSLAAYYDDEFCAYRQTVPMQSDHIGQFLHVSLDPPLAQWLSLVPCYADGGELHE